MQLPDFDTLKNLASEDPAAFEALRLQHIEALLASAPAPMQNRLRGLQFQIDANRQLSKSPLGSCIRISRMMHESFASLREALAGFTHNPDALPALNSETFAREAATVLPFRR